ncbi:MAG: hypothetical protein HY600_07045 [Candidatus Omnitrophica bacterium]|nr:hypothetical protein [Candidatus Omnitrophota bacterium]
MTQWPRGRLLRSLLIVPISVGLVLPSPAFALRQLGLVEDDLPPAATQALTATRTFLDLAA